MNAQRRLIHFAGSVQGVGFRFTALRAADAYRLDGYVRNLPDGRVELLAEGEPAEIDALIRDIQGRLGGYIREITQDISEPTGEFAGFNINF